MRPSSTSAARLGRAVEDGARSLSDAAASRVAAFLEQLEAAGGGFRGRGRSSDVYYTFFALAVLGALGRPVPSPRTIAWLDSFGEGRDLGLVDLCCLARSLARVPGRREAALAAAAGLGRFVSATGGYRPTRDAERGSISASFVAALVHEELALPWRGDERVEACVDAGRAADGAWSDVPGLASGTTPVTAAVALMGTRPHAAASTACWLSARHAGCGFLAGPGTPAPDLLSTAAALLALDALSVPLDGFSAPAVALVCGLWSADGGFRGWAGDTTSDAEFTYYALATLGIARRCGFDAGVAT